MRISIALCTFNGEKFIRDQLDSIAGQTRLPDELIISDDGSTDGTISVIEDFARTGHLPIRIVINEETLGLLNNFNQAIGLCSGEIIFLCDQDDVWFANKIERTLIEFSTDEVTMVFCDADTVDSELNPLSKRLSSITFTDRAKRRQSMDLFEFLLERNIVTGMTMAFRADLRKIALPIPADIPAIIHDGWISMVASLRGRCVFIDESLVMYRQHSNQLIGATDGRLPSVKGERLSRREQIRGYAIVSDYQIDRLERIRANLERQVFPYTDSLAVETAMAKWNTACRYWSDQKEHLERRIELPRNPIRRFPAVFAEYRGGAYSRFSKGIRSALKDLYLP